MGSLPQQTICPVCGNRINRTESFGLGCPVCLLRSGLEETPAKIRPNEVPESLGGYVIVRQEDGEPWELGRGAMGVTYRAQDLSLERQVALKVINADFTLRGADARARFTREARAAAALRHPNVATVHQFGIDEQSGYSYYAMELVEGETLEERVRRSGPLDVRTVVAIACQVTSALAAAEKRGLVHRDLKPANIMISSGEGDSALTVKVIDFGLAKALAETPDARLLTRGGFVGTPAFASPEQLEGSPLDARSDIYSLGATLWYLLTAHTPFGAGEKDPPVEQLKAAHLPVRLTSLLVTMVATEPAARPSVSNLAEQLDRIHQRLSGRKVVSWLLLWGALIALAGILAGRLFYPSPGSSTLPEASIAVLPFESVGDNSGNTYLADGIQDAILTDLTRIAGLKVVSRRSVAQYRGTRQTVREIGQALRVRHLLTGSIRKDGDQIHINTQLVDTTTEAEQWAEKYNSSENELFHTESQISQAIFEKLKIALSPAEKAALTRTPSTNPQAYDLYLRARPLVFQYVALAKDVQQDLDKAVGLLEEATALDPKFTEAYCLLSRAQLSLYAAEFWNKERLPKAKKAVDAALAISPNSPEAHLVLAQYLLQTLPDSVPAARELQIAVTALPGDSEVIGLRANIAERHGHWRQALQDRKTAAELDPRNVQTIGDLIELDISLRRFDEALQLCDQMIASVNQPQTGFFWRRKARIALARGDTKRARAAFDAYPFRKDGLMAFNIELAGLLLRDRQYDKAAEIVKSLEEVARQNDSLPKGQLHGFARGREFELLGEITRAQKQNELARSYFEKARPGFEDWLEKNPAELSVWEARARGYIAVCDVGLGRNEDALREARHAVELWPASRDATVAPEVVTFLALVYCWTGDRAAALEQLESVVHLPFGPTSGDLKLDPRWDELRADPRFDHLIVEAAKPIQL